MCIAAFARYLSMVHEIDMPPDHIVHCAFTTFIVFFSTLCSALFILSMTFYRFYSIIRPHKAASFNTVKRAKITIVGIVIFSTLYNIPHLFVTSSPGVDCKAYGKTRGVSYGEFYYWLSFIINFVFPLLSC